VTGPSAPPLEIVEFTDPACPWAWGSEPKFRRLRATLGANARWRRVFGILFDEDEPPAPDPAAEAAWYHRELAEISSHTGAPYPARLEWVARSSWPASLAAKAAEAQGPLIAERVLERLRETTFLAGTPADTPERVIAALNDLSGLDIDLLARMAAGPETLAAVRRDWAETRSPCAEVLELAEPGRHSGRAKPLGEDPADGYRYALPTLVFTGPAGRAVVPGWRTPDEYLTAAGRAAPVLYELCDLRGNSSKE
jgi:predicted DsbA family dithiol-disulfide isomerase